MSSASRIPGRLVQHQRRGGTTAGWRQRLPLLLARPHCRPCAPQSTAHRTEAGEQLHIQHRSVRLKQLLHLLHLQAPSRWGGAVAASARAAGNRCRPVCCLLYKAGGAGGHSPTHVRPGCTGDKGRPALYRQRMPNVLAVHAARAYPVGGWEVLHVAAVRGREARGRRHGGRACRGRTRPGVAFAKRRSVVLLSSRSSGAAQR